MISREQIQEQAIQLFKYLQPYCSAIYLGGSICEGLIKNVHDIDFICFGTKPIDMCHIRRLIYFYKSTYTVPEEIDLIQVRNEEKEEHAYGSYINKKMIKLVGKEISFHFDVINKDREEYKAILIDTIEKLNTGKILNQKRWYQVLRGYYILKYNSYDLPESDQQILNLVHDQLEGWENYKLSKLDILNL